MNFRLDKTPSMYMWQTKKLTHRTSPVVQQLRLCASTTGAMGSILGEVLHAAQAAKKKKKRISASTLYFTVIISINLGFKKWVDLENSQETCREGKSWRWYQWIKFRKNWLSGSVMQKWREEHPNQWDLTTPPLSTQQELADASFNTKGLTFFSSQSGNTKIYPKPVIYFVNI